MDQAGREGAREAAAARAVDAWQPLIEHPGVAEVLLGVFQKLRLVQIIGSHPHVVLDHRSRQNVRRRNPVDGLAQVAVPVELHTLAGLGQEIEDLVQLDVEQRPRLGPWCDQRVEIELRRDEVDAEVARAVALLDCRNQLAAHEERRGYGGGFLNETQDTPRT